MKQILPIIQSYLRRFPAPTGIQLISNSLLKLNYSFTIPYTNSKTLKQVFYPITKPQLNTQLHSLNKKLKYDDKGRVQQSGSFQTISCEGKHEKIIQDDVFGMAKQNINKTRWVYIAQVKQQKQKSYFTKGHGKLKFEYDFGQTYQGVKNVRIFVWDKLKKQIIKIQTPHSLIPACPIFSNQQGSKIIFHAYKKSQFGHGILHCFNRQVNIYEVQFTIQDQVQDSQQQLLLTKKKVKQQKQRLSLVSPLISDNKRTNIFPCVSVGFEYLVYCSGSGKTHTYYLDLVVMRRQKIKDNNNNQNNNTYKWVQLHRINERLVGYYSTLKIYPSINKQTNKPICYFQSHSGALQKIYKIELQSGQIQQLLTVNNDQQSVGQSFSISQIDQQTGMLIGTTTTHNYNTFFYSLNDNNNNKDNNKQINTNKQKLICIQPPQRQEFTLQQYNQPIHGYYLQAPQHAILTQYKSRVNNRPLLLLVHGGPHGTIDPAFTLFRYSLLKMGYGILMPNFPGSAGFGQQYLQKALKNIGKTDMDAIISLLQKVLQQKPYINKKKVHVYGGSYGGYAGGILGSRYSQYFASVVILNGVLSIPGQLFYGDIPEWNTVQTLGKQELHELSAQDYVQMYRQSVISQPMRVPVLQFLGAKDLRVPYRQGLLFDAMTRKQGGEIMTYVYENSSHSLGDSVDTVVDVIVKSLLFLEGGLKEEQIKGEKQQQQGQFKKVVIIQKQKKQQVNQSQMSKGSEQYNAQKMEQELKQNQNL